MTIGPNLSPSSLDCDENGMRRELITSGSSELYRCAEKSFAMLDAAGSAARLYAKETFPDFPRILNHCGVGVLGGQLTYPTELLHLLTPYISAYCRYYGKEHGLMIRPLLRLGLTAERIACSNIDTTRSKDESRVVPCFIWRLHPVT